MRYKEETLVRGLARGTSSLLWEQLNAARLRFRLLLRLRLASAAASSSFLRPCLRLLVTALGRPRLLLRPPNQGASVTFGFGIWATTALSRSPVLSPAMAWVAPLLALHHPLPALSSRYSV